MSREKRRVPTDSERPGYYTVGERRTPGSGDSDSQLRNVDSLFNHRNAFRCPIQPDQKNAVLMVKRKQHPVSLVDQSAEGFCVSYSGSETFKVGQILRLRSVAGEHEVRVAYAEPENDEMRIGLERLSGVIKPSGGLAAGALFLIIVLTSALLFYISL